MLANHLWQSTLFVALMGLLVVILRRNRASLRYWMWMAASIKFLVPFSLLVAFGDKIGSQLQLHEAIPSKPFLEMPGGWSTFATNVVQPVASYAAAPALQSEAAPLRSTINF